MLAATLADTGALSYPVLASAKYDGVRCIIRDGKALTRSLKIVPNEHIRGALEALGPDGEGLDGEIMLPYPATFHDVSGAVRRHVESPPADWYFVAFDRVPSGATCEAFERRLETVRRAVEKCLWGHVVYCDHERISSADELDAFEARALIAGHEGVMLRSLDGPYKCGRATVGEGYLFKLKRFADSEAVIVDVLEMERNHNEAFIGELGQTKRRTLKENKVPAGIVGKLVVRDLRTGVEFKIGTGLSVKQRQGWWRCRDCLIGRIVRYRYQEHGVKDKPRIASFQGFRERFDM